MTRHFLSATSTRRFAVPAALGCVLFAPAAIAQVEKPQSPRERVIVRGPDVSTVFRMGVSDRDRAMLGVQLGASAQSDTAGVRIDVDADGPAAKAGLKAGDIISEINGVSLRISSADAEDVSLQGLGQRRLQRTMAKVKPGEEVKLRVRTGGSERTVMVKTISAADLNREPARAVVSPRARGDREDARGAIGVSVNATGSSRDTLGLFIASVVDGGPAEKAGVFEGERIAAINGVDVRIPREDLEDSRAVSARVDRFIREVRKAKEGEAITLRVQSAGRAREVKVTAVKMSDLPQTGFQFRIGDDGVQFFRGGASGSALDVMPFEMFTRSPSGARGQVRGFLNGEPFEWDSRSLEEGMGRLRERLQDLGKDLRFELRSTPPRPEGSPVPTRAPQQRGSAHVFR